VHAIQDLDFITTGSITTPPSSKTTTPLEQQFFHANGLEALKTAFGPTKPVPQIVIYDDVLAAYNDEGSGGHAAIVSELNFETGFIYLVDPNPQRRRTASYFNFDDFRRGWNVFDQATIVLYPATFYQTTRSVTTALGLGGTIE